MAEYRRQVGLEVINTGIARAQSYQTRGIESIADVVARREQDIMRGREEEGMRAGRAEGLAAVQEGRSPEQRESNPIMSAIFGKPISTEAFNKGMETSYLAASEADARVSLLELATLNDGDTAGYSEAVKTYRNRIVGAAPADLKQLVGASIDMASRHIGTGVRKAEIKKGKDLMTANFTVGLESNMDAIGTALRQGDDEVAEALLAQRKAYIAQGVESGAIGEDESVLMLQQTEEDYVIENAKGIVLSAYDDAPEGEGFAAAIEALDYLDSVSGDLLGPDEKTAVRNEILAEVKQAESIRSAMVDKQTTEMAGEYVDLLIRAEKGESIMNDAERFRVKWKSTEKGNEKYLSLLKAAKTERNLASQIALVQKTLTSGFPMSPDDATHRDAVDAYFVNVVSPKLGESPDPSGAVYNFISATGVVPKSLISGIINGLSSPATAAKTLDLLDGLQRANPAAINQIPEKKLRDAETMRSLAQAGLPPEQAVSTTLDLANIDSNKADARRSAFSEILESDSDIADRLDKHEPFIGGEAQLPPGMMADYKALAESHYVKTGNSDSAMKLADRYIKARWAVVTRGGERKWVNDPPELHYGIKGAPPEANTAWIYAQASEETGVDPSQIQLVPDPRKVAADGRPVYQVLKVDEDGFWDAAPGQHFVPSYEESDLYRKQMDKAKRDEAKEVNNARRDRRVMTQMRQPGMSGSL